MCFFKTLPTSPVFPTGFSKVDNSDHQGSSEIITSSDLTSPPQQKKELLFSPNQQWLLMNCMGLVNGNSNLMALMDQKLNEAQKRLRKGMETIQMIETVDRTTQKCMSGYVQNSHQKVEKNLFKSKDKLTQKMFQNSEYKYKMVLNGQLPSVLYKERNFNLSVKLVDVENGQQMLNGNIINVCMGVCDDSGEWIHETKERIAFLKGKIQAELYHGSASFVKMAARDVSRSFVNKTVNIVVYPKPTVLQYSGQSSIEQHIDYSLIEPLMIHGVSIKAKKRE